MSKNFFQNGKWTENPSEVKVLECDCGGKYIKTRDGQKTCLRCMKEE